MALFLGDKLIGTNSIGTRIEEKDVNFYDYEGTLLYSYTKQEALALTALPPLPDRTSENLTNEGWNWTLVEIKEQLTDVGGIVNVGCTYTTTDGKTHIFVEILDTLKDINICAYSYNSSALASINWGDGNTETITYTSNSNTSILSHTYASGGVYDISIDGSFRIGTRYLFGISDYNNYRYKVKKLHLGNNLVSIHPYNFRSITIEKIIIPQLSKLVEPSSSHFTNTLPDCIVMPRSYSTIHGYTFNNPNIYRLKESIFVINGNVTTIGYYCGRNADFKNVTLRKNIALGSYCFYGCRLTKLTFPVITSIPNYFASCNYNLSYIDFKEGLESIGNSAFLYALSLSTITIPSTVTSINSNAFARCYLKRIYMKPSTPPTIQTDTFGSGGGFYLASDTIIYVPRNSYNTYITASNWSDLSSYIQPYDF